MEIEVSKGRHPGVFKISNVVIINPSLAEPSKYYKNKQGDNYGVYVLIPKESKAYEVIDGIIVEAAHDTLGKKTKYRSPWLDGDNQLDIEGNPISSPKEYRLNHWHFKCKTHTKPQLRGLTGGDAVAKDFHSGCIVNVWIETNAFNSKNFGSSFVLLNLVALQKINDGEEIDEYAPPVIEDSEFEDLSDEIIEDDGFADL
ncbi:MAG: ssDNA-binding protein [Gammaproteobacteria bacterium]